MVHSKYCGIESKSPRSRTVGSRHHLAGLLQLPFIERDDGNGCVRVRGAKVHGRMHRDVPTPQYTAQLYQFKLLF